ncbi:MULTISPECIES: ribonuclease J [unclassified Granulicatella]|uniref:ribonuclease J n=1 Tax=unclassified Granulicatella TaxID=2630493 RepID=UPI001073048E|nr:MULTISPECIES: ribonuclease J [unclassified Granulicatella]MBF0780426.1 ribonuclease J [Granulicatella sp. 19428wC4_WM01]TFU95415.1 ribonuclease J [Granulicatella sp. WM01]
MKDIKLMSLGGVRENGKNMYVVEINDTIFILDCGLVYPEDELLGIDAIIPDFTYLEENANKIAGIFLTHGHADAVEALAYLLQKIKAPVFGTALTIEIAKLSAKEQGLNSRIKDFYVIDESTEIEFKDVMVSFFKTTHSVPDSVGIVLTTDRGSIVYTGDFRFDQSASELYRTDFSRLVEIGNAGVLALLSDSSNADTHLENDSELQIANDMLDTFANEKGRIVVSCVASNILRVQQVIDAAYATNRKVFLTGRSLVEIIGVALKLKKLVLPDKHILCKLPELKKYRDEEIVILETGQKGEPIHALQRMARQRHPQVNLKEGDLVYIATTPSVSVETMVARTKDWIYRAGASVKSVSDNVRASSHASPNDLKLLMNLLKPQYVIPVNGEFRMMMKHAHLACEVGIDEKNIFLLEKGDILHYQNGNMQLAGRVPTGNILIDGSSVGDIGNIVLRDRKILSEDGVLVAVLTISRRLGIILAEPQIISRGFVYMRNSGNIMQESSALVKKVVEQHLTQLDFDWGRLRSEVREELSQFLFEQTKRRPVVLPIIMEASSYKMPNEQ